MHSFVAKIARDEFGYAVLLRAMDVTDDTVLLKKALFPELVREINSLVLDKYASCVFLHLLAPYSSKYFPKATLEQLQVSARMIVIFDVCASVYNEVLCGLALA